MGFDVGREAESIRPLVGYMSQKAALYDELTVAENLSFYGGLYGLSPAEQRVRQREVLGLVGLDGRQKERAGQISTGWRQRLALAIALVHQPRLVLLDEPTSGVDPAARRDFWDLIDELAQAGATVFVSTHFMDEAEYCGRLGIMNAGRLLAMDSPAALKREALPGPAWNLAVDRLEREFASDGKAADFAALKGCLSVAHRNIGYDRIATELGIAEGSARVAVHRFRKRFSEIYREEIAPCSRNSPRRFPFASG